MRPKEQLHAPQSSAIRDPKDRANIWDHLNLTNPNGKLTLYVIWKGRKARTKARRLDSLVASTSDLAAFPESLTMAHPVGFSNMLELHGKNSMVPLAPEVSFLLRQEMG